MEIIDDQGPLLCDWEVLHHLQQQRDARAHRRTSQSVLTIEFECIDYLKSQPSARRLSLEALRGLMEFLAGRRLSRVERLGIVNQLPASPVEFHVIVEECEERFSDGEMEEILEAIKKLREDEAAGE